MTETPNVSIAVLVSALVVFGLIGIAGMFWADRLVDLSLRMNRGWMGTLNPFRSLLGTQSHREGIRISGLLSLIISVCALLQLVLRLLR
jgi:hypothetical protein